MTLIDDFAPLFEVVEPTRKGVTDAA